MPLLRHIPLACPTCGHQGHYALEPTEDRPLVALVRCEACATPCGVEVRLTVTIETSVCRLALPSTTPVEPAATAAGGAIPPAPAYEARTLTPEVPPEAPLEHPLDLNLADTPLEVDLDVTQESAVPAMAPADGPDWRSAEPWAQTMRDNPLTVRQEDVPRARRVATPMDEDIENMPLEPTAVAQDSAVPAAPVKAARPKATAKPKPKTTRTPKGRK